MAVIFVGTTSWTISGPERWSISATGLDTCTIPYRGAETGRSAFLATLTKGASCPLNGNLFLTEVVNNDDKQFPTVEVRYSGLKSGSHSDVMIGQGTSTQTASYNNGYSELSILYLAPHTTHSWIGDSPTTIVSSGFTGTIEPQILDRRIDGKPTIYSDMYNRFVEAAYANNPTQLAAVEAFLADNADTIATAKQNILDMFNRTFITLDVTTMEAECVVPGRYWQCTATTTRTLVTSSA